jgi:hypothetical protein
MKISNHIFLKIILITCLIPAAIRCTAQADEHGVKMSSDYDSFNIKSKSFLLPQALPKWHYYHSLSVSYVVVPREWTLDDINAPMLTYSGKFTLPLGINMQASLATLGISNRLNFGPFWNYSINNFHFGLGYQFAFNLGYLGSFGYQTKFTGWEQQPSIIVGYSCPKAALTLRADLYYTNSVDFIEGSHSFPIWNSFTNGYGLTGTYEQRLYKNKVVSFGVKLNYVRYHIIAWPAFPVNQYRYYVPEFQIGINF